MGKPSREYIGGVHAEVKKVGLQTLIYGHRHGPEVAHMVTLGLSPGQARLFLFLFESAARNGYQPSSREIMDHFGFACPSATASFVAGLRKKGWLGEGIKGQGYAQGRSYRILRRPDGGPFLGFAAITKEVDS